MERQRKTHQDNRDASHRLAPAANTAKARVTFAASPAVRPGSQNGRQDDLPCIGLRPVSGCFFRMRNAGGDGRSRRECARSALATRGSCRRLPRHRAQHSHHRGSELLSSFVRPRPSGLFSPRHDRRRLCRRNVTLRDHVLL